MPADAARSAARLAHHRSRRLWLWRPGPADLPELCRLHRDPLVMATLGGVRSDAWTHELVAAIERHWRDHGFGLWTLRDRQTGAFVGRGGLRRVEVGGRREVEVAYVLARERWGSGLATELAIESARVAFDELGLEEIVAFTLPGNRASRAVMERTRLRFERNIVRADLPHVMYRLRARER